MCRNLEKNIHKVYIKVLFHCSNINTGILCRLIALIEKIMNMKYFRFPQRNMPEDQYPERRH